MYKLSRILTLSLLALFFCAPAVQAADATCLAYGPGTGCTSISGPGHCDASNVCVPDAKSLTAGNTAGQGAINTTYINGYKISIVSIINDYLVPVLIAVAFIVFLYGVYKFFIAGASEESTKGEGRRFAAWGVVGFVIILSLWGIVNIVKDTLIPKETNLTVPKYPTL